MTMQEPWARIVCLEAERDIISTSTDADNISTYRVCVVIVGVSRDPYNVECVTMKVEGVLYGVFNIF